ncbi:hypothetical protein EV356DRAFT_464663 [Viridothelium virens]|uniref:DUF676 domain-containing protein n=1 Tax=Viridothelium virens TaxID=1048519 RepID=A0A6A6HD53_VIRVR|nr:hypothetical protein EV356DRAFT_464663 [Viridothelium virens]
MVTNTHQIESESCVQSYSPRAVRFDTLLPSTELGSQRNIGEETRTKITQKDFRDGGLIASILRICYGTFEQRKAAIVVIQILLSRNLHQRRHLEVEVSFQPRHIRSRKDKDNVQFPIVRNLAPRKVYGIPNTDGLTWSYKIEQLCFNPSVASGISSAMSNEARNTFEVSPSLSIIGKPWSDSRRREVHKACWIIKDKGQPSVGIPDEVYLGAIVQYEDTFQADVRVTLDAPSYLKFFAFPWPQDDPILFPNRDPGPFIGGDIGITQFETLSDTEWSTLLSGYVNPNVGAKKETVKEASTVATRGLKTFRVQGIPPECGPEAIPALLFGLFGLSHDQKPDIETFSLCADVERVNEHVATISSAQLQAALGTGDQWKAPLASDNGGATLAGRRHIVMDTHFYGITPLSAPKDRDEHLYDIVALSGLGGHAFGSFKERKGDYMWLRDSLPNDFPHARVLTYGYDTKLEDSRSIQDLDAIAGTFRTALKATRPRYSDGRLNDRPIIFISHSLGGILLKQVH